MSMFYQQEEKLYQNTKQVIDVNKRHPFVIAAEKINWRKMFEELHPILYKGIKKFSGRRLDIRAHCGIYLLQAVHNWTDRFSEEMLKYYAPVRIFCGYDFDSTKSLDHTRIEKFRNRIGKEGAEIMNKYLLLIAKKGGHTNGKKMDMDTTVQEAGITYPTEMKLMQKFRERTKIIVDKALGVKDKVSEKLELLGKKAKDILKEYCFFTKEKEGKKALIEKTRKICATFLSELKKVSTSKAVKKLRPFLKKELARLLKNMPILLKQIKQWLNTGIVAKDKIISLHKDMPQFIKKGKIGKKVEIGRKFIINQYTNGFLLITAPEEGNISDLDCVKISLEESIKIFGKVPESYGADRGMYSKSNIDLCKEYEIEEIGIQPRGQKEWEVDRETAQVLYCRRAAIEPRIGIAGKLGLKKSRAKTDNGDVISGLKAALGFNLKKLMTCWSN